MQVDQKKLRCICGKSKIFPLCDGRHRAAGWRCGEGRETIVSHVFLASPALRNLADRLAHRFQGVSLHHISGSLRCAQLVVLTDGHDLPLIQQQMLRCEAESVRVISIGLHADAAQWAFPGRQVVHIPDGDAMGLWAKVEAAVTTKAGDQTLRERPRVFVSHAVQDESVLFPVIELIREHYGIPLFLCADSIRVGSQWRSRIQTQLDRCERFLYIASPAANVSTYCAFEAGMAMGRHKSIRIVSIDGCPPPAHLQDIQASSVPRLRARKPWLDPDDALTECILNAIY